MSLGGDTVVQDACTGDHLGTGVTTCKSRVSSCNDAASPVLPVICEGDNSFSMILTMMCAGKLFKSADLPTFIEFILLFYETKPVDWLLSNYLFIKVCLDNYEPKYCPKALERAVRRFKPSLFQHMGVESSLKGKVQKLRVSAGNFCNTGLLSVSFFRSCH